MEHPDVSAVAIEHLEREQEVFSLVTVRDEEGLGCAVVLPVQVQLLHILKSKACSLLHGSGPTSSCRFSFCTT